MAGVKGRSGGARTGAGRKPNKSAVTGVMDPLLFLQKVWTGEIQANTNQIRAAASALPFMHPKKAGEVAKKEVAAPVAGKYAARTGPRLVASK